MTNTFEGGCRCGRIRYRVTAEKLPNAYACHCRDCQTWSGSAFSVQFVLPENQFAVTGEPQLFEITGRESGRTSRQRGCPICFTRLYNTNSARPGLVTIRAGTLDRSDELEIAAHIWTKRKIAGFSIPDALPNWPEGAPLADLIAVLSR